jgi:DNA-binding NtrC family response regulator
MIRKKGGIIMHLLLVDDEERFLNTTSKLLTQKGLMVFTAKNGPDALELLKHQNIHVVLLDLKMPGMDGITTLREIKCHFPLVEVIILTGHGTVESAVKALKSGATDYLSKPVDIDELIAKTEEAFAKYRRLEEKIFLAQNIYETRKALYMKSPKEVFKVSDFKK